MFNELNEDLQVCHSCDTPACVNPSHLFQGTAKVNSDDKLNKDRGIGKLTNEQVAKIRALPMTDTILEEVSEKYEISKDSARSILNGKTYSHLPGARRIVRQKSKRRLTDEQVSEIKAELSKGTWGQQVRLAKKYGVSRAVIQRIQYGTYY